MFLISSAQAHSHPRRKEMSVRQAATDERLTSLQSLRAIAALLVLLHHVMKMPGPASSAGVYALKLTFGPFCSSGVDLFFVISGFVIAHSISSERAAPAHIFLAGRAIRIFPLFWVMSAIYGWQLWSSGSPISGTALANAITLMPLSGQEGYTYPILYVGWSLAFEIGFYILAGLTILQARARRAPALLILLTCLSAVGTFAGGLAGPMAFFLNPITLEFAFGVVAWILWRKGLNAKIAAGLTAVGFTLFVSGLFINIGQGFETDPAKIIANITSLQRALIWGLPAAMLLLGLVATSPLKGSADHLLARIGDASFSLYLVHPLVLFQIRQVRLPIWINNDLVFMALLILLSVAAALLMHEYIEKPIIRWGKIVTGKRALSPVIVCRAPPLQ